MRLTSAALVVLACLALVVPAFGADPLAADEKLLRDVGLGVDGPALLEFFKRRTPTEDLRDRIEDLIKQMGDDDFEVREKASESLIRIGSATVAALNQALKEKDLDPEIRVRATKCLTVIEKIAGVPVTAAALRLLADRKPAGAVAVVLGFLPYADEALVEETHRALTAVGFRDGKADPDLLDALDDEDRPVVRAAAAVAIIRGGKAADRAPLKKLFKDPDALVRLRVAMAFLELKDKESVPVLIGLLPDAPVEKSWLIEDALYLLAGDEPPEVPGGNDKAARARASAAWAAWWEKQGDSIDLAKIDFNKRTVGNLLIVELNRGTTGRVYEIGHDKKVVWEINALRRPVAAQVVEDDRVLIAEYSSRLITERTFKGEVKWQKTTPALLRGAERLPGGNTLLVTTRQLQEIDKDGKDVGGAYTRPTNDILTARVLPDGGKVLLLSNGNCLILDKDNKEGKPFAVAGPTGIGASIEVTPNGNILVPQPSQNKVVEFDPTGKQVWEAAVNAPTCAIRLPNGRTVVASSVNQRIVELDRGGREIWEYKTDGRVMLIRKR